VVVFLSDLEGRFTMPDGTTEDRKVKAGAVAWSDAMAHNPENLSSKPLEVLHIDIK
jgi:mannose-6-phosphate isomerase-like protein (cupin superfamily)